MSRAKISLLLLSLVFAIVVLVFCEFIFEQDHSMNIPITPVADSVVKVGACYTLNNKENKFSHEVAMKVVAYDNTYVKYQYFFNDNLSRWSDATTSEKVWSDWAAVWTETTCPLSFAQKIGVK